MNLLKAVLFDLGNVLVDVDPHYFWKNLGFASEEEIMPFKEEYISRLTQYESGNTGTDDFLCGLHLLFAKKFSKEHLRRAFSGIIREQIAGMVDIVRHVSFRYTTTLVSNTNEIHYDICLKKCDALQFLHTHYLSYRLLAVKPDFRFYEAIIKDQNVLPSKLLFIDDSPENVDAAKAAGMKGIQFKNIDQFKIALESDFIL